MVDIVIRKLTKEQYKELKLLKIERDSNSWADMFITMVNEWRIKKEKTKRTGES